MTSQIPNLTQDQPTSPLIDSRSDDSITLVKAVSGGSNATGGNLSLTEGPSSGVSIRLGSEQSSVPSEFYSYSQIPYPTISKLNSPSAQATALKSRYQNDSPTVNSGPVPAKCRPVPRPPPRSVSESDVETSRPLPPRTYLNNNVCSPSSRNRNPFMTDCTNEISTSCNGRTSPRSRRGRQRLCVITAFVAIFLALALAGTAAFFSIHTYLTTRDSKQEVVQGKEQLGDLGVSQNQSIASAHVGLMVKHLTAEAKRTFISNYTLYLTDDKARLHYNNVKIWDRGLTIQMKGMYFVYSSIGFNINENVMKCDELEHKTWLHHVMLSRSDKDIALLRSERTCCTGCPEYHTSGFTGGVFELLAGDNLFVRVSAPILVFGDKESSFLGLFLVKGR